MKIRHSDSFPVRAETKDNKKRSGLSPFRFLHFKNQTQIDHVIALRKEGSFEKTMAFLEELLSVNPNNPENYYQNSKRVFNRAIDSFPDNGAFKVFNAMTEYKGLLHLAQNRSHSVKFIVSHSNDKFKSLRT